MSDPLVSIGVPSYNRPDTLRVTIDSILSQSYKNIELIVSDNASPDGAVLSLLKAYAAQDSRVSFFAHPENLGPVKNFISVLEKARGEYFMWCGDDDYLGCTDYIEKAVATLQRSPDLVSVCGACYRDDKKGRVNKVSGTEGNFLSDNRWLRMLSTYLATSPRLINVYGLTKRVVLLDGCALNVFPFDRHLLAYIAYCGKIRMLEDIRFVRFTGGAGSGTAKEGHARMARMSGLRYSSVLGVRCIFACNAASVFRNSLVYSGVGRLWRTIFAGALFSASAFDSLRRYFFRPVMKKIKSRVAQWRLAQDEQKH